MTNQQRQSLAELVRKRRLELGIGVRELARLIEAEISYIAQIEAGGVKQPGFERLQALAEALDMPADELFIAAGYEPSALPEMGAYFRAKYGLGNEAVEDIERYVSRIKKRYEGSHD